MLQSPEWKSKLRKASFRGAAFFVFGTSTDGGRRVVSHEYPGRDVPYVEDLGRRGRAYTVEAFVIGDDYMPARDKLIEALEFRGPGILIHPFLGELNLQVEQFSWSETRDDGGMASFQIAFRQTDPVIYPTTAENVVAQTASNAQYVLAAFEEFFNRTYTIASENRTLVQETALQSTTDAAALIGTRMKPAVSRLTGGLDQFTRDLASFAANASALITEPASMAFQLQSLLSRLTVATDPIKALAVYNRLFDDVTGYFARKTYGASTASQQSAANDRALEQVIIFGIISCAAYVAVNSDFDSMQQAENTRTMLDSMIEAQIYTITDDDVYQAVTELRTSIDSSIPPAGATLANEVNVPVLMPTPSLALAYNIYGDVSNELDIVARNDIHNPFCVPAGSVTVLMWSTVLMSS